MRSPQPNNFSANCGGFADSIYHLWMVFNGAERMAIVELTGGLGHQLFQYAAARALAVREGRALRFAFHLHRADVHRRYMLDVFRLAPNVRRRPLSLMRLRLLGLRSPISRGKAGKLWRTAVCRLDRIDERGASYTPLASTARGVVLEGYFQSFRYFADVQREIRDNLQIVRPPTGPNATLLSRMRDQNAVCLHVRRGDYVLDRTATAAPFVLGLSYYRVALETLGRSTTGATYYVFSDDPAWTRAHLKPEGPTVFVDHNSAREPWEDLRLMAACRHFVIANSSLGWWGAYLSTSPDRKVIAPTRWFADAASDTSDLYPPEWERL